MLRRSPAKADDDVALDDVLLKRFLDRGARFLSGRRRRQQGNQAHQEHQADDPSTAINLKRSAMVTHYAMLALERFSHEDTANPGEDKTPLPPLSGGNPADPERSRQDAVLNT